MFHGAISGLLQDFESGKLTRRQLIHALALGVTAGPAALAATQNRRNNPTSRYRAPRIRSIEFSSVPTSPSLRASVLQNHTLHFPI